MATTVAEFFNIMLPDYAPPSTLQELIPYILIVVTGIALVSGVFGILGRLLQIILDVTRWNK